MYELVVDFPRYPEFLRWCTDTELLERRDDGITARLHVRFGALRTSFATRNTNDPGRSVRLELAEGPFRHLEGLWTFRQLGEEGSRVILEMSFEFSGALGGVAGVAFQRLADRMVNDFVARAHAVYGGQNAHTD